HRAGRDDIAAPIHRETRPDRAVAMIHRLVHSPVALDCPAHRPTALPPHAPALSANLRTAATATHLPRSVSPISALASANREQCRLPRSSGLRAPSMPTAHGGIRVA